MTQGTQSSIPRVGTLGVPRDRGQGQGAAQALRALASNFARLSGPSVPAGAVGLSGLSARTTGARAPSDFDELIKQAARREGIDEDLVRAVVEVESGFRPDAVSSAGAMGLMQLMPGTARTLGVRNAFDPVANLSGGAKFLGSLLHRFQSVPLALAAYNAGPGAVEQYGGVPPYAETKAYVSRVLDAQRRNATARAPKQIGGIDGERPMG